MKNLQLALLGALLSVGSVWAGESCSLSLAGAWKATLSDGRSQVVRLPGSISEQGLGNAITLDTPWTLSLRPGWRAAWPEVVAHPENVKMPFFLTPSHYYVGKVVFTRTIDVPDAAMGRLAELFLERAHWCSVVFVDGVEKGRGEALSAPQKIPLGELAPGRHELRLEIDNAIHAINPGINAHSISDHIAGNWNGAIGRLAIDFRARDEIASVKLTPDRATRTLIAEVRTASGKMGVVTQPMPLNVEDWDEFHPNLYTAEIAFGGDVKKVRYGVRSWRREGKRLFLNDHPAFLRGTVHCAQCPRTGYPATDRAEWERQLKTMKAWGFNHVRFHSWCPPEAAFEVADELGLYFQIEASVWTTVGDGGATDRWLHEEAARIVEAYGNHPSFCLLVHGNEPSGRNQKKFLADFVRSWHARDSRFLVSAASGWPKLPESDVFVDPSPRLYRWGEGMGSRINSAPPTADFNFIDQTAKAERPVITHEQGQWCAFPNLREIAKYTGDLKAKNFELFRDRLAKNGLAALADDFLFASGRLQTLCYKHDMEAVLRTPGMGGYQILSLVDFMGQGTALTGLMDAFHEEKGYVGPDEFRRWNAPLVPLARLSSFAFTGEVARVVLEAANYARPLKNAQVKWSVGTLGGTLSVNELPLGSPLALGTIEIDFARLPAPARYTLRVEIDGAMNEWPVWNLPARIETPKVEVFTAVDDRLEQVLADGGRAILSLPKGFLASKAGANRVLGFSTVFWNTAWTAGQPPHTNGLIPDPAHPALAGFPCVKVSDWLWWEACLKGSAIRYDLLDPAIRPIVRVVPDWFTSEPLALLAEVKVGKGRLIVSGVDFRGEQMSRPETRLLFKSVCDYLLSDRTTPVVEVPLEKVRTLEAAQGRVRAIACSSDEAGGWEMKNACDGDPATIWHTRWKNGKDPEPPHWITFMLRRESVLKGVTVSGRLDGNPNGLVKACRVETSLDGKTWQVAAEKTLAKTAKAQTIPFARPVKARFVKFTALSVHVGPWAHLAEFDVVE